MERRQKAQEWKNNVNLCQMSKSMFYNEYVHVNHSNVILIILIMYFMPN